MNTKHVTYLLNCINHDLETIKLRLETLPDSIKKEIAQIKVDELEVIFAGIANDNAVNNPTEYAIESVKLLESLDESK